jgi:hypothetical protein
MLEAVAEARAARATMSSAWLLNGYRPHVVPEKEALDAETRVKSFRNKLVDLQQEMFDMTWEWSDDSETEQ